jgi:hypothetical protein
MRLRNALCLFALGCSLASASSLTFSFSGFQITTRSTAAGTGSLAFADGISTVGLPDLTAFSYSGYVKSIYGGPTVVLPEVYGLSDLADFSLSIAGGAVSTFALDTVRQPAWPTQFSVFGQAPFFYGNTGADIVGGVEITSFEAAPVPEPITFALLGLGMVAIGGWRKLARRSLTLSPLG